MSFDLHLLIGGQGGFQFSAQSGQEALHIGWRLDETRGPEFPGFYDPALLRRGQRRLGHIRRWVIRRGVIGFGWRKLRPLNGGQRPVVGVLGGLPGLGNVGNAGGLGGSAEQLRQFTGGRLAQARVRPSLVKLVCDRSDPVLNLSDDRPPRIGDQLVVHAARRVAEIGHLLQQVVGMGRSQDILHSGQGGTGLGLGFQLQPVLGQRIHRRA